MARPRTSPTQRQASPEPGESAPTAALARAVGEHIAQQWNAPPSSTPTDERILDATTDVLDLHGPRFTIDDVAEHSGVSRATVFRRFGNKEALTAAAFIREFQRSTEQITAAVAGTGDKDMAVVELFATCLEVVHINPMARRLARTDPRSAVSILTKGSPSPLARTREIFDQYIGETRERRGIGTENVAEIADALVHLLFAYAVLPDSPVDMGDRRQVRHFAQTIVMPLMLKSAPGFSIGDS